MVTTENVVTIHGTIPLKTIPQQIDLDFQGQVAFVGMSVKVFPTSKT